MPQGRGLGRRASMVPMPRLLLRATPEPFNVERTLDLPTQYVTWYDQGHEGACVGFSCSWMMSIINRRKYDAPKLYRRAQEIDEWIETPPEEGTSVHAACQVLETEGHWRYTRGMSKILSLGEGIQAVRWAHSVDELRYCISIGTPFVLGINWYNEFFSPFYKPINQGFVKGEWWIGTQPWGNVAGGHAICAFAASDRRQAFRLVNTWGYDYPRPWISYESINRLLHEDGEAALVTDRMEIK